MSARGKSKASGAKALSQTQIRSNIAARTGLTKKQVGEVFAAMEAEMAQELKQQGTFNLGGLIKVTKVHKPAKPARQGRRPGTSDMMTYKAQKARNVVKARALKNLKDLV